MFYVTVISELGFSVTYIFIFDGNYFICKFLNAENDDCMTINLK